MGNDCFKGKKQTNKVGSETIFESPRDNPNSQKVTDRERRIDISKSGGSGHTKITIHNLSYNNVPEK